MKILMLASGTPHSSLTHRIVALGGQLAQRGHNVTIAAPRIDKHSQWQLDQPPAIDGVRFIYPFQFASRSMILNLLPYILDVSRLILRERPQLVYIYKPTPLTIPGLLAKLTRRTPIITDLDDLGSEVMQLERQPAYIWKLTAWCERMATRHANGVVGASRLIVSEVQARYPGKPTLRLSNGVNPQEFTPNTNSRRLAPHIVFFGLLSRTSITKPLLAAYAAARQASPQAFAKVQLDMMGDGQSKTELEAYTQSLGIAEATTFWGWTTYEQFRSRVQTGDIAICVMPNERTTAACSNQKVFQYQAMELTPLVSKVGDLPLYVEDGKAGLVVEPDDLDSLTQALIQLVDDAKLRHQLATRSRHLATTIYAWKQLATQLNDFVEQLQ